MRKKLIEVALPLDAINRASAREKSIRQGHPSTLHLWWARRPLAAARAVIFAQMVDDPSSWPDLFPTEKAQEEERQRLFRIIEELVKWENTTNEKVLQQARDEIWQNWWRTCAENANHPLAVELFNKDKLPAFHDSFAGGGSLPLEAQRLGLESYASDLNPVAVLICKAMIEIPPKFAGNPPVNPEARRDKKLFDREWKGVQGLAEDVRYYGQWMRNEAEKRIGHLYPRINITMEMAKERSDLEPYIGKNLTIIAWLWARTVKSPNPAFAHIDVPLASTFMLSTKKGKEAYIEPIIEDSGYRFTVKMGKPTDPEATKLGTAAGKRSAFRCLMSGVPVTYDHIRSESKAGRMGTRLMAIVAEGARGRVYIGPTPEHEVAANKAKPEWMPEVEFFQQALGFRVGNYGMTKWSDLFTDRQIVALTTFLDLINKARECIRNDTVSAGLPDDGTSLCDGGTGATAYADAVGVYLVFAISKLADRGSTICGWDVSRDSLRNTFGRQAISMVWDFAEANSLSDSAGSYNNAVEQVAKVLFGFLPANTIGCSQQVDASVQGVSIGKIISTDPPYYDNVGYADLSDFFYVWQRRALRQVFPDLFATLTVPKADELVATPDRHGSREKAETFFLDGMTQAMRRLAEQAHPTFPVTIYYAFKQSESKSGGGTANTGWETFLDAVTRAGFAVSGTWPMRTELGNRMRGMESNALASSIVLVCRKRPEDATRTTRREFLIALKRDLPQAIRTLQHGNIAPVDLAQASIGPGMAIFSRYASVLEADGSPMRVRMALGLINQVLDEILAEQEGEFDPDTRWALAWFEQFSMDEAPFGEANTLANAKNTSVQGLVAAGILEARGGRVRLLKREEMNGAWDPTTDQRLTVWEVTQHLIRTLELDGEAGAGALIARVGALSDAARDLAYRLYGICERKHRAQEALAYNSLVIAWPEIARLAAEQPPVPTQESLL